ncbi:hypothetical protein K439DRAFT_1277263, partial [Ramaria rubella]
SIIMQNIISVKHRAGVENPADGLSRKWGEGQTTVGEGEDSEDAKGTVNDLFTVLSANKEMRAVRERVTSDPYFSDIALWLTTLQTTMSLNTAESQRARQKSMEYMVEKGKLWRVGGKRAHRAARVECVPAMEGEARAKECHENGHWGRELCETQLQTTHFWPCMRRDVVNAI